MMKPGKNARKRGLALSLFGVAALGCAAPDEVTTPEITWRGQWLAYGAGDDVEPACEATLAYMDEYVGFLASEFEIADDVRVQFFHQASKTERHCSRGRKNVPACVSGANVFSAYAPLEHELVHAVRSYADFSNLFFEEGAAEFWGDDSHIVPARFDTGRDVLDAMRAADENGTDGKDYGVAGRFVAFLVETRGLDRMNELMRRTTTRTRFDDLRAVLVDIYGDEPEQLAAEFEAYPVCNQEEFRSSDFVCENARVVQWCVDGKSVDLEETIACEAADVLGPRDGEIWKQIVVDIAQPGTYALALFPEDHSVEASIVVRGCSSGCGTFFERYFFPGGASVAEFLELSEGRYVFRISRSEMSPGISGFTLSGGGCTITGG